MFVSVLGWLLVLAGTYMMLAQIASIWISNRRNERGGSIVPLVNGVLISVGLFVLYGWGWHCIVPLVIDPGGIISFVFTFIYQIVVTKKDS